MKPEQIKQAITKKGFNLSLIAESLNIGLPTVSAVIRRSSNSLRTATAIAKVIGLPITEVFPDVPQYTKTLEVKLSDDERAQKVAQINQLLGKPFDKQLDKQ